MLAMLYCMAIIRWDLWITWLLLIMNVISSMTSVLGFMFVLSNPLSYFFQKKKKLSFQKKNRIFLKLMLSKKNHFLYPSFLIMIYLVNPLNFYTLALQSLLRDICHIENGYTVCAVQLVYVCTRVFYMFSCNSNFMRLTTHKINACLYLVVMWFELIPTQ